MTDITDYPTLWFGLEEPHIRALIHDISPSISERYVKRDDSTNVFQEGGTLYWGSAKFSEPSVRAVRLTVPQIRDWIAQHEKPVEEPIYFCGKPIKFQDANGRLLLPDGHASGIYVNYSLIRAIAARLDREKRD